MPVANLVAIIAPFGPAPSPHKHDPQPITSPSISCFCVIGSSFSTTRQTRCFRTGSGKRSCVRNPTPLRAREKTCHGAGRSTEPLERLHVAETGDLSEIGRPMGRVLQ